MNEKDRYKVQWMRRDIDLEHSNVSDEDILILLEGSFLDARLELSYAIRTFKKELAQTDLGIFIHKILDKLEYYPSRMVVV